MIYYNFLSAKFHPTQHFVGNISLCILKFVSVRGSTFLCNIADLRNLLNFISNTHSAIYMFHLSHSSCSSNWRRIREMFHSIHAELFSWYYLLLILNTSLHLLWDSTLNDSFNSHTRNPKYIFLYIIQWWTLSTDCALTVNVTTVL